ncbi:MAG: PEGA domain-containing protein [Ignavibacteriales bacterium]|nr:PEGA domain-containing protein [Ignavibacteriales bacterium]
MKSFNIKLKYITIFVVALILSCNKEVSVSPPEEPIHTGFVYIESNPNYAKIYLNGRNTGKVTPDSLRWLEAGKQTVTLRLTGWKDSTLQLNIIESERLNFFFDFTKNLAMCGYIDCKTHPTDADIFLNDSALGKKTPYQISNLFPGEYKVKFKKDRYLDDSIDVTVQSQAITSIYKVLVDTTVWVNFKTSNSGLPSSYILSIAVDKNNLKWIGTDGGGLAVFDEKDWIIYATDNSPLPDNRINVLYIDDEDNIWIGTTSAGLVKFYNNSWTIYDKNNSGLPADMITALTKDKNGNLWIGTYNKGVAVFNSNSWKAYDIDNSDLPSNYISSIAIIDTNIWIGTREGLVNFKPEGKSVFYNSTNSSIPNRISALAVGVLGELYIGTIYMGSNGIAILINNEFKLLDNIFNSDITTISVDKFNHVWMGSSLNGFGLLFNNIGFKGIFNKYNSPINADGVNAIAIDKNMYKWIGTYGGGLVKFKNFR